MLVTWNLNLNVPHNERRVSCAISQPGASPRMDSKSTWARAKNCLFVVIPALIVLCCVFWLVVQRARRVSIESSIDTNAPPPYPDSRLVFQNEWYTASTCEEERVYTTTHSSNQVVAFMEDYMPGFVQEQAYENEKVVSRNSYTDTSWAARLSALTQTSRCDGLDLYCEEVEYYLPTVRVWIIEYDDHRVGTEVRYRLSWPCP